MRAITVKKTEGFQIKSIPSKSITNSEAEIRKALEEAKRQAYSDMGFNF